MEESNMKYQSKRNGQIAELIEKNEKTKMVTLQSVDDKKYMPVTISTFQRWWKKVDDTIQQEPETKEADNVVAEDKKQAAKEKSDIVKSDKKQKKAQIAEEEKVGDGTPLAEVGKEIAEQAKQKAEKAKNIKNESADANSPFDIALSALKDFDYSYNGRKYIGVKCNKNVICAIYPRKSRIRIYTTDAYFKHIKKNKSLYELKGQGTSKFAISMYVDAENINEVLNTMLKEDN